MNIDDPAAHTLNGFATHPDVLAVTSTTSYDLFAADYSNWGEAVAVCAPSNRPGGHGILAADVLEVSQRLRRNLVRLAGELEVDPAAARRSWRLEVKSNLDDALATVEQALAVIDQG